MDINCQVQKESFPTEFLALQDGRWPFRSSQLTSLRPFFDHDDRMIRLQRRTHLSTEEAVDVRILPANQNIKIIVLDTHHRLLHAGNNHTLTEQILILQERRAV